MWQLRIHVDVVLSSMSALHPRYLSLIRRRQFERELGLDHRAHAPYDHALYAQAPYGHVLCAWLKVLVCVHYVCVFDCGSFVLKGLGLS